MVGGVFIGSVIWWLTLIGSISLFCRRMDQRAMRWVNRISGLVILTFGVTAAGSVLVDIF